MQSKTHFTLSGLFILFNWLLCPLLCAQSDPVQNQGRVPTDHIALDVCDFSDNDSAFWNADGWWDPVHNSYNLNEMAIDLHYTVEGACSGPNATFRYLLYLDLDRNGFLETVVNSELLPSIDGTVYFDNANTPFFQGGTPLRFDNRPVPSASLDCYRFALEITQNGAKTTASLRFNTRRYPTEYTLPLLPHGKHAIIWIVRDACGHETVSQQDFNIIDCAKPTIHCKPLSVNIMQTGMVTLWASDFWEFANDNATPPELLRIAVSTGESAPDNFPVDTATGQPETQITFICPKLGSNTIQLWAQDAAGNAAYCQTTLLVEDAMGNCAEKASIMGYVKTETEKPLANVGIQCSSTLGQFWSSSYTYSNTNGFFAFPMALPIGAEANICAAIDEDQVSGINVLDLIILAQHLEHIKPLDSAYKIFAADANRSGALDTLDLEVLQKLILGIYDKLPNSPSWRFFDKFTIPLGPFNPFEDIINLQTVDCANTNAHPFKIDTVQLIGIKIGDLNDSALPNSATRTVHLDTQDQTFETGDELTVVLTGSDTLAGQQFTLEHPGLEFIGFQSNTVGLFFDDFGIFPQTQTLTHVWGTPATKGERPNFTLRFRAKDAGTLSQQLRLSNKITYTEAYSPLDPITCAAERLKIALRFNTVSNQEPEKPSDRRFALLQNQPNPFYDATAIGFYLPEAGHVTLNIVDVSGKQLLLQSGAFDQGYQQFLIESAQLPKQGFFYYTVSTKGQFLTKTMTRM